MALTISGTDTLDFTGDNAIRKGVTQRFEYELELDNQPLSLDDSQGFVVEFYRSGKEFPNPMMVSVEQTYDTNDSTSEETLKETCLIIEFDPDITLMPELPPYDYQYTLYILFNDEASETYATPLATGTVELLKTYSGIRSV